MFFLVCIILIVYISFILTLYLHCIFTIEPWEKLLSTVIRVDNDRDTIGLGDSTNVLNNNNKLLVRSIINRNADPKKFTIYQIMIIIILT